MVDAIVYINLEYRTDRKNHVLQELKKLACISTNIHRIDAVLEKWCGHLGCGKSHVKALELAILHQWDSVLIVEDDVAFDGDLSKIHTVKHIPWDVMMLGYGHHSLRDCEYNFLKRVNRATCTHAYIVRKHYYETLLANFTSAVATMEIELEKHMEQNKHTPKKMHYCSAIDQTWDSLQSKDIFYTFQPVLATQSGLVSDSNCEIQYQEHLMKELFARVK
jgi:hypothetical protein